MELRYSTVGVLLFQNPLKDLIRCDMTTWFLNWTGWTSTHVIRFTRSHFSRQIDFIKKIDQLFRPSAGVPHGCVLGPKLFNLHTNCVQLIKEIRFGVYITFRNVDWQNRLLEWAQLWRLKLEMPKIAYSCGQKQFREGCAARESVGPLSL